MRIKSWGGVSALNALISGYGSTMAISLSVDVDVEFSDENKIEAFDSLLIEEIIKQIGMGNRFRVKVDSQVPPGVGLKSSSAVSSALALAIMSLIDGQSNVDKAVRISAYLSKKLKISITGAHDDAYASLLGGIVLTFNDEERLISRLNVNDEMEVIIGIPKGIKKSINLGRLRSMKVIGLELKEVIENGKWVHAMTINGMAVAAANGYDALPIIEAVREGALAAGISGNGPTYFCIVKRGWGVPRGFDGLKVIKTVPQNSGYIIMP